jgi:mannose-6-phosphate isomerase-like protein (cupin superfamily)
MQKTMATQRSRVVRYDNLEPQYHVPGAKEPGFIRWLISWVGGPQGYINSNREDAAISEEMVVGMMNLPVGQKQKGLHYHSVTEIYVILRGQLESYDGKGQKHYAGPMDCIYIPKGVPHGVRNCGTVDCDLIWIHDGIEKVGTSVYFMDGLVPDSYVQREEISIVKLQDLEPSYKAHRAKEVGYLRWSVNWVAGAAAAGYETYNPTGVVLSNKIALGLTVLPPGQKQVLHSHRDMGEAYIVLRGKAVLNTGESHKKERLSALDGAYFPPCAPHSLRNCGDEALHILWVHEQPQKIGRTEYIE